MKIYLIGFMGAGKTTIGRELARRIGAPFFDLDGYTDFGTIEAGKRARLLAVNVPSGTDDVEEYLVGGIRPEQIRWIDT